MIIQVFLDDTAVSASLFSGHTLPGDSVIPFQADQNNVQIHGTDGGILCLLILKFPDNPVVDVPEIGSKILIFHGQNPTVGREIPECDILNTQSDNLQRCFFNGQRKTGIPRIQQKDVAPGNLQLLSVKRQNSASLLDKDDLSVAEYTIHEMLTLASIIELEGSTSDDRAGVAGVFYNRLKTGEPLGSDVTTYYGSKKDFSRDLSKANLKDCNGYNTRAESSCPILGLPVGPICSPSLASISATIEPEEHDYYFFVADKNKKTYFSKTYSEHVSTVAKLKKDGLWYEYQY